LRRKDRPRILKERPIRSFLSERTTLILEKPLLVRKEEGSVEATGRHRSVFGLTRESRPEPLKGVRGFVARARPEQIGLQKPHTHLSYEGQSKLDYCVECLSKHSQAGSVLMREAVQRAEAGSPSDPGVLEKVRGAVKELVGFEDDSDTVKNERISGLNTAARELRKLIYLKRAEIGGASLGDLREIKGMMDKLVDATYTVRTSEECIGCTVEELCGGNLECVTFVERAAKSVKDPAEFRKILEQARAKYGRG